MISVYLDDLRTPIVPPSENSNWIVVRNYEDFIDLVQSSGLDNIEIISMDHDLDTTATDHYMYEVRKNYTIDYSKIKEKTGLDAAKWLIQYSIESKKPLPKCYVHSANPIGAGNMMGQINLYLKLCKKPEDCIRIWWDYEIKGRIFKK